MAISEAQLVGEFNASVWAREFVAHVKANPSIAVDEDTMVGWFANAIMAGFDGHARRAAPPRAGEWNAAEALYAFGGWLTSRETPVTMSATHDAAVVADLIAAFCKRHDLAEPRDGWHQAIVHEGTRASRAPQKRAGEHMEETRDETTGLGASAQGDGDGGQQELPTSEPTESSEAPAPSDPGDESEK